MKVTCSVISDLLPLYAEGLAGDDSRALVEAHVKDCPRCQQQLTALGTAAPLPAEGAMPLLAVNRLLRRHTVLWCVLVGCLVAAIALSVLGHVTSPRLVEKSETALFAGQGEDGLPFVRVGLHSPMGIDYEVSYLSDTDGGRYMIISGCTSPWLRSMGCDRRGETYYADSREVSRIYFLSPAGDLIRLYGEDRTGGIILLPRLALSYYVLCALVLFLVFGLLALCFRRSPHGRTLLPAAMAFGCYVLAHLIIKGLDGTSHFLLQDLTFILLTAAAIWGALFALRGILALNRR